MIRTESHLTLGKIPIKLFGEDLWVEDVFVDGKSFQNQLKLEFKQEFSQGRFKEPFMLRLLSKNKEVVVPIYGCSDGCCDYVFVKIKKNDQQVIWEKIGRNSTYIYPKTKCKNKIDWLKNYRPITFSKNNYNAVKPNQIGDESQ